jgi:hypothetical protein
MDPTVTAALISGGALILSGGWTAFVAFTTTRNARQTTQATIDAAAENTARALDAAREERIWDKRAEAYLDALRLVHQRQDSRAKTMRRLREDEETGESIQESIDGLRLPGWPDAELRLLAYASPQVIDAVQASRQAHEQLLVVLEASAQVRDWSKNSEHNAPPGTQGSELREAIVPGLKHAADTDTALLAAIRADLHSMPSHAAALPPDDSGA